MNTTALKSGLVLCAALMSLATWPTAASARERTSSVTGPNGQTATRSVSRAQGDVSSTTTGPNGGASTRSVERSAGSTKVIVTGPNGKTASRTTTRQP